MSNVFIKYKFNYLIWQDFISGEMFGEFLLVDELARVLLFRDRRFQENSVYTKASAVSIGEEK
jgi:hypothetical protein